MLELVEKTKATANRLLPCLSQLSTQCDATFAGDRWIVQSCLEIKERIVRTLAALDSDEFLFNGSMAPHPVSDLELWSFGSQDADSISETTRRWRSTLAEPAYRKIPLENLKEVFDYYFRYDLYGAFENVDTLILSSGSKELPFYTPPAGIRLSLDVANRNVWFGYSDSLGHTETREAIARCEAIRRRDSAIRKEHVACIQGGTHGLHVILSLLAKSGVTGNFAFLTPTYVPILDDLQEHFGTLPIDVPCSYTTSISPLLDSLQLESTAGILLCLPHNPPLVEPITSDQLDQLAVECARRDKWLIIDEVLSPDEYLLYSAERHPTTVIIKSYSKFFGIPGLKLGHLLAKPELVDKLYRYASTSYGSPPSFSYLTSTMINVLEHYQLSGECFLNSEIEATLSESKLLFKEYNLWLEAEQFLKQSNGLLLNRIEKLRHSPSIKQFFLPKDSSNNRIMATGLKGPSYRTFLEILKRKNTSVFPLDCMAQVDDRHDLRITTTIDPFNLVRGVCAIIEVTDDLYAHQLRELWIDQCDWEILCTYGLLDYHSELNWAGHAMRVVLRARQLYELHNINCPRTVERACALHDIGKVWSHIGNTQREFYWKRLFSERLPEELQNQWCDKIWGEWILRKINFHLQSEQQLVGFVLNSYYNEDDDSPWYALLNVVDKTSDFIGSADLSWTILKEALRLKSQQTGRRYSLPREKRESELQHSLKQLDSLKELFDNENEKLLPSNFESAADIECITAT